MSETMAVIHDVKSAAARAKVTEAVILQWVRDGLKATPVGRVGKRGPANYRIFDAWLIEFLERRAVVAVKAADAPARRPGRKSSPPAGADQIGPCPKVKAKS